MSYFIEEIVTSADPPSRPVPARDGVTQIDSHVDDLVDANTRLTAVDHDTKTLAEAASESSLTGKTVSIGQKIGKYEIRAQLGTGGMGAVYLAFDPLIEREVAIKVLSPDLSSSATALQRFLGEARAIGRLNHANVVSIYDIDQWNGQYYLVMELLSGGSAANCVEQSGRVPWEEACRIIAQAARGLAAAHDAGMIHRDIKPENLMLSKDGSVKVVDFGLSKLLDASHDPQAAVTKAGQILGTPQYMSPEQFEAADIDARTDIYSLGATLFRLLTGRFPYQDSRSIVQVMTAHMTKPPPVATDFEPAAPAECDRIISRSMAKNPADRYQSCAQLATELEALLSGPATPVASIGDVIADRPLQSAVIVEPSKLQGAVLKDAFARVGVQAVRVVGTMDAARQTAASEMPDIFITAMELPDGRGIELLQSLSRQTLFRRSTVVLNSSDSTIEELTSATQAECLVLAPKKVRPEDILRVAHATGPTLVTNGALAAPIDATSMRLQIVLDSGRIPDLLVDLIRGLDLLDFEVIEGSTSVNISDTPPNLVLLLRRSDGAGQSADFASAVQQSPDFIPMIAAVQINQGKLNLRAVCRNRVVAICDRVLDAARLVCLLQSCRP